MRTALAYTVIPDGAFAGMTIGSSRYPTPTTIIVAQPSAARCACANTLARTNPGRK